MTRTILCVSAALLCCIGASFGQTTQNNQGAAMQTVSDSTLIAALPVPSDELQQFQQSVKDIHFDFNMADLRDEDRAILARDAEWLKAHPDVVITLEGDADERGDIIYNLVLSGSRASNTRDALVQLGVPSNRIAFATGWGKLYPICGQSEENCWSQNRRTHFATWPPESQVSASGVTQAQGTK